MAFMSLFLGFYLFIIGICAVIGIGLFVLGGIGVYTIAKSRGYDKPYLAFIPFADGYLLGAIADNINQCNGQKSNYRIYLVIGYAVSGLSYVFSIMSTFSMLDNLYTTNYGPNIGAIGIVSSLSGLALIACMVFKFIALHKIYTDYSPKNGLLMTLLSIFFGIYQIFLFAIRKNASASTYRAQYQSQYNYNQQQYYNNYQANAQQNNANNYQQQQEYSQQAQASQQYTNNPNQYNAQQNNQAPPQNNNQPPCN